MAKTLGILAAASLVGCLLLPAVGASAQPSISIRVGLYYNASSLAAATLQPAGPSANVMYSEGGADALVPGQSYIRDFAYRDLVLQTPSLASGQAEVSTLSQQNHAAYLEQMPNGSYDVYSGPYSSESSAQAAAASLPTATILGPYGVLVTGEASLAAAQAAAQAISQTGQTAYPMLLQGGWGVLAGDYATSASAQAILPTLQAQYPTAQLYTPTGSELEVQLPTASVAFLVQTAAALQVQGDQGVVAIQGKAYRGDLSFTLQGTALEVVNTLPLEQYLYGVVPSEMPASWSPAALQAQAVASRTYALYQIQHSSPQSRFDVYGNTYSQAYGGYSAEQPSSDAAVDSTANIVMTYSGQTIDAVFSADSGGATENAVNVWGTEVPYLLGVDELPGYQPTTWVITYTASQIAGFVAAWSGQNIGALQQVVLQGVQQTFSGRPLDVQFVGSGGQYTVWRDSIRGLLRLPSTLFTLTSDGQVYAQGADGTAALPSLAGAVADGAAGTDPLPSTVQAEGAGGTTASYPLVPTSYTLNGRGNGHGVGMSQDGAQYMAEQGYAYQAILSHYYTGVAFSPDN
ncbi:MAG: SpoIID/LytB domain-containing protein [Thermaerobacter sp.]|nr:SpoIID/LytB domain-containing protein [Thermaerobacter sp.]